MRILGVNRAEFIAGLIAIAVGIFAIVESRRFQIGSAVNMGPGYFPFLLGTAMIVFGLGIMLVEGRARESEPIQRPAYRPLIAIMAAVLAFILLIESLGLAPAVLAAVFLSALAERRPSLVRVSVTAVVMAILTVMVFQYGLGLQVQAFKYGF